MAGVIPDPGELGDHHRHPFQGPQVGGEPVGQGALDQGLLDAGQVSGRQLGIGTGRPPNLGGLLFRVPAELGDWVVPLWVSVIGLLIPAALAIWAFRRVRQVERQT